MNLNLLWFFFLQQRRTLLPFSFLERFDRLNEAFSLTLIFRFVSLLLFIITILLVYWCVRLTIFLLRLQPNFVKFCHSGWMVVSGSYYLLFRCSYFDHFFRWSCLLICCLWLISFIFQVSEMVRHSLINSIFDSALKKKMQYCCFECFESILLSLFIYCAGCFQPT